LFRTLGMRVGLNSDDASEEGKRRGRFGMPNQSIHVQTREKRAMSAKGGGEGGINGA